MTTTTKRPKPYRLIIMEDFDRCDDRKLCKHCSPAQHTICQAELNRQYEHERQRYEKEQAR